MKRPGVELRPQSGGGKSSPGIDEHDKPEATTYERLEDDHGGESTAGQALPSEHDPTGQRFVWRGARLYKIRPTHGTAARPLAVVNPPLSPSWTPPKKGKS
jgi:hypothetical protein